MTAHGVLIPVAYVAQNIDSLNRSAFSLLDYDNGEIMYLSGKSTVADETEVWAGIAPATAGGGSALTGLWMAYQPEIVVTTSGDSQYKGIDPNPQNFYIPASTSTVRHVFSIFRPQLGDILTMTTDSLSGAYSAGVTTHINATNAGGKQLVWANVVGVSVLSLKLIAVSYISLATGGVDTQRVTAYTFEVVVL